MYKYFTKVSLFSTVGFKYNFGTTVVRNSAAWLLAISHVSEIAAAALLGLVLLSGIGQITELIYRLMEPVIAWTLHRALVSMLLACIALHALAFLVESGTPFSIVQALIPFDLHNVPVTLSGAHIEAMLFGLGLVLLYAAGAFILLSIFSVSVKPIIWQFIEYIVIAGVILLLLYGLRIGTYYVPGLMRTLWWVGCGCVYLVALLHIRKQRIKA